MELSGVSVSKARNLHGPEPSLPACSRQGRAHSARRAWPEIGGKTLPAVGASCTKGGSSMVDVGAERQARAVSEGRARGRVNACTFLAAVKGPSEKRVPAFESTNVTSKKRRHWADFCYI